MAKKISKKVTNTGKVCTDCHECNICSWMSLIIGILIIYLGWMYTVSWVRWTLVVAGVLLIIKRWLPCNKGKSL